MSEKNRKGKSGCFMMSGWFLLAGAIVILILFGIIISLHQLGIWDEFWAEQWWQ